jgi:hypothetical protein
MQSSGAVLSYFASAINLISYCPPEMAGVAGGEFFRTSTTPKEVVLTVQPGLKSSLKSAELSFSPSRPVSRLTTLPTGENLVVEPTGSWSLGWRSSLSNMSSSTRSPAHPRRSTSDRGRESESRARERECSLSKAWRMEGKVWRRSHGINDRYNR